MQALPSSVLSELDALPADATLLQHGPWRVLHLRPGQGPATLREIGRLRSLTYKAAGMGVDAEIDLDRFDDVFDQLVLVHDEDRALAGGYRLGWCGDLLAAHGIRALYLPTLFQVGAPLERELHHAVEVGRSFITPDYQRQLRPLGLLWNAIGIAIARRGGDTWALFGSVSIPATLTVQSRARICGFLREHQWHDALGAAVLPRSPVDFPLPRDTPQTFRTLDRSLDEGDLSPVLLRKYAQLGGRYLGFNVDPDFGDCIDCLVWVDLRETDPRRLEGYVGAEVRAVLQGDVHVVAAK